MTKGTLQAWNNSSKSSLSRDIMVAGTYSAFSRVYAGLKPTAIALMNSYNVVNVVSHQLPPFYCTMENHWQCQTSKWVTKYKVCATNDSKPLTLCVNMSFGFEKL